MKRISSTLFALFILVTGSVVAQDNQTQTLDANQVGKLDLNGKWSGKRHQYSWDKKSYIETFQYEFDLKQEGDIITGTSTIISSNGEYADMKLEGVIVGNKFHFREYEVKSAVRPEGKLWCFKSGELNIVKDGENIKLVGATSSYMETYNYPCSGGYTDITKVDNSNNTVAIQQFDNNTTAVNPNAEIQVNAFPNPFVDNTTIGYTLVDQSKVKLEVFDISGKLATTIFDGTQAAGNYTKTFDGKANGSNSGIYIIKLTVNGQVYSRQLVQMR